MADSINPITVTTTKQELFAATGITVGVSIIIENTGGLPVLYAEKATEPTTELSGVLRSGEQATVTAGSSGVWVWTATSIARLTVQVA